MGRTMRGWRGWALLGMALVVLGAVLVSVFASREETSFTATPYADVVRFAAKAPVVTLQVQIHDLSGGTVWDSGVVAGFTVDWNRTNEWGERLAYGVYLYQAQGWDAQGELVFGRSGKLALLPGDRVQLQAAPAVPTSGRGDAGLPTLAPMGLSDIGIFSQVGIGTASPVATLEVMKDTDFQLRLQRVASFFGPLQGRNKGNARFLMGVDSLYNAAIELHKGKTGYNQGYALYIDFAFADDVDHNARFIMLDPNLLQLTGNASFAYTGAGNVGIGTSNTTAKLTIEDSSGQDLIAAYNSSNRVFVVKSNGEVRADGAYYGTGFHTGGADVAERINTSEWVEAGNVVEIDPDHPGFFRKSRAPYSTKVAGIVSTSPGVILGNDFEENIDDWEDNRPVLAIAGRVPVKATTENGPIQIGDLLVSSSAPGVAMRGTDREGCIGAVVGKAMEPLETGTGTIMMQVMLR